MMKRKFVVNFGEHKDTSIDFLLAAFDDARATTLRRLENLSHEELHWQYAEDWNSISVLLEHFIGGSHSFRNWIFEKRELNEKEKDLYLPGVEMGKYIPEIIAKNRDLDYYLKALETSRNLMNEAISKMTLEDMSQIVEGAYDKETGANLAWILYHVVEDEVHHRGQISYIRKLYNCRDI